MTHYAEVLDEVLEFAREKKEKGKTGTVYIQEKELGPAGDIILGDEDTGSKFEEQIRLVLETTDGVIYYDDAFEEMLFYKQAIGQLEELREYYPFEWVSEAVMEEKMEKPRE